MALSGVQCHEEVGQVFEELKNRKTKYIIFQVGKKEGESVDTIHVIKDSKDEDWEQFIENFDEKEPRYAVYDLEYELAEGEGKRNKILFIAWIPDTAGVKKKMIYSTTSQALRDNLSVPTFYIQATDDSDIAFDTIKAKVIGK